MSHNKYTKQDCIDALDKAYDILGHPPSQHQYKKLDIKPSYQTITNKFERWNLAKEAADMETNKPSHLKYQDGSPDIIDCTEEEWESLSKNVRARRRKQAIVAKKKLSEGCNKCGYKDHPVGLTYHHDNTDNKFKGVSQLVQAGYSLDRIEEEIDKCTLYCRICHQILENKNVYNV